MAFYSQSVPMPNVPPIGGLPVYQRTDRLYVRLDLSRPLGQATVGKPRPTVADLWRDFAHEERARELGAAKAPTKIRAA